MQTPVPPSSAAKHANFPFSVLFQRRIDLIVSRTEALRKESNSSDASFLRVCAMCIRQNSFKNFLHSSVCGSRDPHISSAIVSVCVRWLSLLVCVRVVIDSLRPEKNMAKGKGTKVMHNFVHIFVWAMNVQPDRTKRWHSKTVNGRRQVKFEKKRQFGGTAMHSLQFHSDNKQTEEKQNTKSEFKVNFNEKFCDSDSDRLRRGWRCDVWNNGLKGKTNYFTRRKQSETNGKMFFWEGRWRRRLIFHFSHSNG